MRIDLFIFHLLMYSSVNSFIYPLFLGHQLLRSSCENWQSELFEVIFILLMIFFSLRLSKKQLEKALDIYASKLSKHFEIVQLELSTVLLFLIL